MAGSATLTTVASSTTRPDPSTVTNRTHRPAGERCRTHMAAPSLAKPHRVTNCVVLRNSHGIRVAPRRARLTRQGGEMAMTTRSRRKGARAGVLAIAAVSVLLLGEPRAAIAGGPTDQIRAHIAVMYRALGASVSAPSPSGTGSVRKVADQMFDWRAIAREALGDHSTKRSAEEQNEFARLFVNLFEDAYLSKIRLAEADKFEDLGETAVGDGAGGRPRAVTRNGSAIPINDLTRRDAAAGDPEHHLPVGARHHDRR